MIVPYMIRWEVLKHHLGFELPNDDLSTVLIKWKDAMVKVSSIVIGLEYNILT